VPLVDSYLEDGAGSIEDTKFIGHCREHTARVFELLDKTRDLTESRLLVIDNGTGCLPRSLAEGDTDVVAVELTDNLKKSATALNNYPNIIYRKTNPLLIAEEFDLIIDSGILCHFPPQILNHFLPRMARFCRRKMIVEFRLTRPWHLRLFPGAVDADRVCPDLAEFRFSRNDIQTLIEVSCDMLLTERNLSGTSILVKALKKPHSYRSGLLR